MTEINPSSHAFDQAIRLVPTEPNQFCGHTSEPYANMVGPFGGITAATLLNAVMQHPERIGANRRPTRLDRQLRLSLWSSITKNEQLMYDGEFMPSYQLAALSLHA